MKICTENVCSISFLFTFEIKPRRPIGNLLKSDASRDWNSLPTNVTKQPTHSEFKNECYNFKLRSYTDSTLNFSPNKF